MEHLDQTRKSKYQINLPQIKAQTKSVNLPHLIYFILKTQRQHTPYFHPYKTRHIYTDETGQFPINSRKGNK